MLALRTAVSTPRLAVRTVRSTRLVVRAQVDAKVPVTFAAASVLSNLALANAASASEVINQLAAGGDARANLLLIPEVLSISWVAFIIFEAAKGQVDNMTDKKKGLIAGLGLGSAALLSAQSAQAAEIAQLADNRLSILTFPVLVALGWVAFVAGGLVLNQLDAMNEKKNGLIAGLGLGGAAFFSAQSAQAAEIAQLADNRLSILTFPVLVALGWVAFVAGGLVLNQLDAMNEKKKGLIAGLGLGSAALLSAQSAQAAEIAQLADNRLSILTFPVLVALGWVAFVAGGLVLNQLDAMNEKAN